MKSLTWRQVNAWRLSQHGLAPRMKRRHFVQSVTRTGGLQAQVMSAAELSLGARVEGLTPQDVQAALWQDRSLIKTWAMRATLHLIAAIDLPLYVAARSVYEARNWEKYFTYFEITPAQSEAFLAAVPQVLGREPMTREQLAVAVARHVGAPELGRRLLSSSWGSLWKPSAWRGDLCFGPNQGRHVTFVRPSEWLGQWQTFEPQQALQEVVRRYLRAFGPGTVEGFARWWDGGGGITPARKVFQSLMDGQELEPVQVEGWPAYALRSTLGAMQKAAPALKGERASVRLLPLFDAYLMGLSHHLEPVLPAAYKSRVFRPQGWISAVVLVDGMVRGVWEFETRRAETAIRVHPFSPLTAAVHKGIEAEVERLGAFLNTRVVLAIEAPL